MFAAARNWSEGRVAQRQRLHLRSFIGFGNGTTASSRTFTKAAKTSRKRKIQQACFPDFRASLAEEKIIRPLSEPGEGVIFPHAAQRIHRHCVDCRLSVFRMACGTKTPREKGKQIVSFAAIPDSNGSSKFFTIGTHFDT
jgi:hypothetical protein